MTQVGLFCGDFEYKHLPGVLPSQHLVMAKIWGKEGSPPDDPATPLQ